MDEKTGIDLCLGGNAGRPQLLDKTAAVARGVAEPERLRHWPPDSTRREVLPRCAAARREEFGLEDALGRFKRLACLPPPTLARRIGPATGPGHLHAGLRRHLPHRVHERKVLDLHHEFDGCARRLAAETVVEALGLVDMKRRGLLVVERAKALVLSGARRFEPDGLSDDGGDGCAGLQFLEKAVR